MSAAGPAPALGGTAARGRGLRLVGGHGVPPRRGLRTGRGPGVSAMASAWGGSRSCRSSNERFSASRQYSAVLNGAFPHGHRLHDNRATALSGDGACRLKGRRWTNPRRRLRPRLRPQTEGRSPGDLSTGGTQKRMALGEPCGGARSWRGAGFRCQPGARWMPYALGEGSGEGRRVRVAELGCGVRH